MQHSFDVRIAEKYGIQPAIILNHLYFWIEKNRANEKNFYDGHYWTYNSKKALTKLFPYMTARQIDYAMKKLIDEGLVITGHYNKLAYDRTLWYAITKLGYSILQNCEMEETKARETILQNCEMEKTELSNGIDDIVEPIPDINTDINTDNNKKERKRENGENIEPQNLSFEMGVKPKESKKESFDDIIDNYTTNTELRKELKEHLKTRKSKKAPLTNRTIELGLKELDRIAKTDKQKIQVVQKAIMRGWTSFFPLKDDDIYAPAYTQKSYDIEDFKFNIFDDEESEHEENNTTTSIGSTRADNDFQLGKVEA